MITYFSYVPQWAQKSKKVQYPFLRQTDFHEISGKKNHHYFELWIRTLSYRTIQIIICLSNVRSIQKYIYIAWFALFLIYETHRVVVDTSKPLFNTNFSVLCITSLQLAALIFLKCRRCISSYVYYYFFITELDKVMDEEGMKPKHFVDVNAVNVVIDQNFAASRLFTRKTSDFRRFDQSQESNQKLLEIY